MLAAFVAAKRTPEHLQLVHLTLSPGHTPHMRPPAAPGDQESSTGGESHAVPTAPAQIKLQIRVAKQKAPQDLSH